MARDAFLLPFIHLCDLMPFVYLVTTIIDSNKWHSSDETRETNRELYSTLKSANRAARAWAKDNKDDDDEDYDEGRYSSDGCYSESWDASKYQSYSVKVEVERIFDPDLMKGEQDETDSDDENDDGEGDDSDGQSSEVEIVSPPAKRTRN